MVDIATKPKIDVVAGIIIGPGDEVLIARRPDHLDQGGLWEFPGGKREDNESSAQALVRELHEELDIVAEQALPVLNRVHEYPNKIVSLTFYEVTKWRGVACGKEGQTINWVSNEELEQFEFPAANDVVLRARRFPRFILKVSTQILSAISLERLEHCLALGLKNVHLSIVNFSSTEYQQCEQVSRLCESYGSQLLVDGPESALADFPNAGFHLPRYRLDAFDRRPIPSERLFTCECMNVDEFKKAMLIDADAVLIPPDVKRQGGPIDAIASHRELLNHSAVPIFAVSDIETVDFCEVLNQGYYGIAISGAELCSRTPEYIKARLGDVVHEATIDLKA